VIAAASVISVRVPMAHPTTAAIASACGVEKQAFSTTSRMSPRKTSNSRASCSASTLCPLDASEPTSTRPPLPPCPLK
jgi:hypothetical protein